MSAPRELCWLVTLWTPFPLDAELWWHAEDPLAVDLWFPDDLVTWTLGRDLLSDGLNSPSGEHDVKVYPYNSQWITIELSSPAGHLTILISRDTLRGFLRATYRVIPRGSEVIPDSCFEELLV